jgi:hypothetical protein
MKLLMYCKQLKSRQHDRRLVVLVFAFATLSVNRIALRETGREIEMYPSAFAITLVQLLCLHRFAFNLGKPKAIQLSLPSASAQARALPAHPRGRRREHPRARRRGGGLA